MALQFRSDFMHASTVAMLLLAGILHTLPAQPSLGVVAAHLVANPQNHRKISTIWTPPPLSTTETPPTSTDYDFDPNTINATPVNLTVLHEFCWPPFDECSVSAEFHRIELAFKFPVNIDCRDRPTNGAAAVNVNPSSVRNPYSNVAEITLNGCSVSGQLNRTLGVEFIPDPVAVRRLRLRMFHVVGDIVGSSFAGFGQLEDLQITDNIIDSIGADSWRGLSELKTLSVCNNNVSSVAVNAFGGLHRLENFTLDETAVELTKGFELPVELAELIVRAKRFEWLTSWPKSLQRLRIHQTFLVYTNDAMRETLEKSLPNLEALEVTGCNLTHWPAFRQATLKHLNISNNQLQYLDDFQLPSLIWLDISSNRLLHLSDTMFRPCASLQTLDVHDNRLEQLASMAFARNARLDVVRLDDNALRQITPQLSVQQQTRIRIDANPWSCKWALDILDSHPEIFAHFQYEKVLNDVNMRGLRCQFYDNGVGGGDAKKNGVGRGDLDVSGSGRNATTTTLWTSYRRHPKDTAMLTLIILIVGVTVLFVLLFLHIRCRNDAMLEPFYRTLPYEQRGLAQGQMHRKQPSAVSTAGSTPTVVGIDYVRRDLPATDYEAPILCRAGRARMETPIPSSSSTTEEASTSDADADENVVGGGNNAARLEGLMATSPTASNASTAIGVDAVDAVDGGERFYEEIKECRRKAVKLNSKKSVTTDDVETGDLMMEVMKAAVQAQQR